jgi:hypothetical protein
MIYFTLRISTLRSPEYIGSEPTARATWLNLLAYCCEQENGGVIPVCSGWKDRQWQQTCGITLTEAQEQSPLWQWDGSDVVVAFYPADKQAEIEAKREAGRRGGRRSGKTRREAVPQAAREAELQAELQAEPQAHLERNVMECKVKESKVKRVRVAVTATNDEEWLGELSQNPAYATLDVRLELGKMQAWCSANGKQPSRKRFVNWLNRSERPMSACGIAPSQSRKPMSAWELKQAMDAIKTQMQRLRSDPENTEAKDPAIPWERGLKPAVSEQVKQLKQREQELQSQLTLLGKEYAPTLKL